MIDCKPLITKTKILYDFCYDVQENGIDLQSVKKWRSVAVDAFVIINKYDPELNYMKAIISDFLLCDEVVSNIEIEENDSTRSHKKEHITDSLKNSFNQINEAFEKLSFNLKFFGQLNFFDNNIVAVGANGSGKTSLADNLRTNLNNNGLVISAQRVLFIPGFESIPTLKITENRWSALNKKSRTFKDIQDFLEIKEEFEYVLSNLIAKHIGHANKYFNSSLLEVQNNERITPPTKSQLEETLEIWNDVFDYRKLILSDGINIIVTIKEIQGNNDNSYEPIRLSEGEKAALYLIGQVIQAPKKGFIIIDEPEMYLHKTIISRLWNKLEALRDDCIFIYLTHDLDFATSRGTAKKVWIKSFEYPNSWNIEEIPDNEIPEALMLELLGSRKNILFCEGAKDSIDANIYKILFPNTTVIPVGSCLNVINFTKAYNKIPIVNTKAFGLIDSDFHSRERLDSLVKEKIFNFSMAEVENLFLINDYLIEAADRLFIDKSKIQLFKNDVLSSLETEIEIQAAKYVSCKINNYFKDSDLSNGNNKDLVRENFSKFTGQIEIDKWFEERVIFLKRIVKTSNYSEAIKVYNNKGLKQIADRYFNRNFVDFAIKHIANEERLQSIIKNVFPEQLLRLTN
ncbi:MAG: ATP-binding protein [Mucilaginibacter sp.]|nr:ATP-binding protein [Mucilaginibacter sp.]